MELKPGDVKYKSAQELAVSIGVRVTLEVDSDNTMGAGLLYQQLEKSGWYWDEKALAWSNRRPVNVDDIPF